MKRMVREVKVEVKPLSDLFELIGDDAAAEFKGTLAKLRERLGDRVFWHINSTAKGGGVAEMLPHLLGYMKDFGIDARWMVISGTPDFFQVTKRLHHALHGSLGDGSALGPKQRATYEAVVEDNCREVMERVCEEDVVILHDPQTAGLAAALVDLGCSVGWRCHIGHDERSLPVERGWGFLAPYVSSAHACVFTRTAYVPAECSHMESMIIAPSIDPLSPKNEMLSPDTVRRIVAHIGIVEGHSGDEEVRFEHSDGTIGCVKRRAEIVRRGKASAPDTPLVIQVSRWDPLKDFSGVLEGFVKLIENGSAADAELVMIGPDVRSVSDDPEGLKVYGQVEDIWRQLPERIQERIHLVSLPMDDIEENAAMVNAIQRHAEVVVQKSLYEGFGLTVTEAMWKGKAMVASAVGGIRDQIEHEKSGLLLDNPRDIDAFSSLLSRLLDDREFRRQLGENARDRVMKEFLVTRHSRQYLEFVELLDKIVAEMDAEPDQLAG